MPETPAFAVRDVVQITDEADPWYGTLLVVNEVKSPRRVMAFHQAPSNVVGEHGGCAYRFLSPDKVTRIGQVPLTLAEATSANRDDD